MFELLCCSREIEGFNRTGLRNSACIISLLVCLSGSLEAQHTAIATLVQEPPWNASLDHIDSSGLVTLNDGKQRRVLSREQLLSWGTHREPLGRSQIVLNRGGLLSANVVSLNEHHVEIESKRLGPVQLPRKHVRAIVFCPLADQLDRDRMLIELQSTRSQNSTVYLQNGDRLSGTFEGTSKTGVPDQDEQEQYHFRHEGRTFAVSRDTLVALRFHSTSQPAERDLPWFQIGLDDGSLLTVQQVQSHPDRLVLILPGDLRLDVKPDAAQQPFSSITFLWLANPRVTYVSDLYPLGYRHIPFLNETWSYGTDKNVLGGRLRSAGSIYSKGIGMHSAARLAYQLDSKFTRLEAELAIDELAGFEGSVQFQVAVDEGSGTWKLAYTSEPIRGGKPPQACSVDITGAVRMALFVGFADRGDVWDHANWLNARLVN